jgi:hypothetical protein
LQFSPYPGKIKNASIFASFSITKYFILWQIFFKFYVSDIIIISKKFNLC